MFSVPQFIDVEDKVAGPLTWKQLLWMIGMGAALLMIFAYFDNTLAIIISVPTVGLFMGLAFYRPNGFPLSSMIFHGFLFMFRPKVAVWERPVRSLKQVKEPPKKEATPPPARKELTPERLKELATLLDSRGH